MRSAWGGNGSRLGSLLEEATLLVEKRRAPTSSLGRSSCDALSDGGGIEGPTFCSGVGVRVGSSFPARDSKRLAGMESLRNRSPSRSRSSLSIHRSSSRLSVRQSSRSGLDMLPHLGSGERSLGLKVDRSSIGARRPRSRKSKSPRPLPRPLPTNPPLPKTGCPKGGWSAYVDPVSNGPSLESRRGLPMSRSRGGGPSRKFLGGDLGLGETGLGLRSKSRSLNERSVPSGGASLNSRNSGREGPPRPRGPSGAVEPVPGPGPRTESVNVLGPLGGSGLVLPKSVCLLLNPGLEGPGRHSWYLGGERDRALDA